MLLMLPVGVPLIVHISGKRKPERSELAAKMTLDITTALQTALSKGFCHSDLRPDNIVVKPPHHCVLVDWGLARAPAEPMHDCSGGIPFFHDDIVMYFFDKEDREVGEAAPPPPAYIAEYDAASLAFVAHAVVAGYKKLEVPWAGSIGQNMIARRNAELGKA